MIFERVVVGGLDANCYILKSNGAGLIIDPGAEPQKILQVIDNLTIKIILATHRHFDHTDAIKAIKAATRAPAAIHPADWLDIFDQELHHGQIIDLGEEKIEVIHLGVDVNRIPFHHRRKEEMNLNLIQIL